MLKNLHINNVLFPLIALFAFKTLAQDITPLTPPLEVAQKYPLNVLWAIKANFVNQADHSHLVVPVAGISASVDLSKQSKIVLTLDALGSAYGYVLYDSKNTRFPSFDSQAFVDELFLEHKFNKNLSTQIGKIRYVPTNGENPLPFGTSNPLILSETYFPRWAALVDLHSQDQKNYAQVFVGESEDGKSDLELSSEGLFLGTKIHLQATDLVGLHASALMSEQVNQKDYWLSTLGVQVSNSDKTFETFLNGLFYDNSPYRLNPDSKYAIEGGLKCRPSGINDKKEIGLVATCIEEESNQLVAYFKYQINKSTHILVLAGYRDYDSMLNDAGLEDGPVVGFAFETIQSLFKSK